MSAFGALKSRRLDAVVLAALILAVFANAPGAAFLWDDPLDIVDNPSARAASFLDRLPAMNRPVTKLSYALNDALHGPWAAGYAAVNVALHAIAALLILALLRRALRERADGDVWALAIAALWAVHPALTESVTYLSGRSMLLSAALMLGALVAATGERPRPGLAFACALAAPLARETALVLSLVLVWWQMTVGAGPGGAFKRALPVWAGALAAAAALAMMPRHRDLVAFSLAQRDVLTALRGNVHAAADILAYWATPWRVTILPDQPLNYFWSEWPTLVRLAGFAAAAGAGFLLRRRAPAAAFGIGLALLALAPSNSIVWRLDPVALKPLYLGGLGLTVAAGALLMRLPWRGGLMVSALATIVLAAMTVERNQLFASPVALWRDAVEKTPENGRAWINYGAALMGEGRYDEAEAALQTGLDFLPHDLTALNLLDQLATIRGVEGRGSRP